MALVVCMCAALMSEPMAPCFTMSCAMVALTWLGFGFGFGFGFGLGLGLASCVSPLTSCSSRSLSISRK